MRNTTLRVFLFLPLFAVSCYALKVKDHPITTPRRLELTQKYCLQHYNLDSYQLKDPAMIVIHYTAISTLEKSLRTFTDDTLAAHRKEILGHGDVNVGVHFVVDKNGDVYALLPTDIIGRHTIGFNHVSLGIENVAGDATELTDKQLAANIELIKDLVAKFPSIEYLIGHHEYTQTGLPHYNLFKELDKTYAPTHKTDPGPEFMLKLRDRLSKIGIQLKE